MESDQLVFDFQDGCAPGHEEFVYRGLERAHITYPGKDISVRLTDLDDPDADNRIPAEIAAALGAANCFWLMLPMCNDADDVARYIEIIGSIDSTWLSEKGRLQLIVETPQCLENLSRILVKHPEISGVIVGLADFGRFAQMDRTELHKRLAWHVLNACLAHRRFPIDTASLSMAVSEDVVRQTFAHGMRGQAVLHPANTSITNQGLTPTKSEAMKHLEQVESWVSSGACGYVMGSGGDFIGPPHMRQQRWIVQHYAAHVAGLHSHVYSIDSSDLSASLSRVLQAFAEDTGAYASPKSPSASMAIVLSLAACHDDHSRLVANLGYANISMPAGGGVAVHEMRWVLTQDLERRRTRSGHRDVLVQQVTLLDGEYNPLLTFARSILEEQPFDTVLDELDGCLQGRLPSADVYKQLNQAPFSPVGEQEVRSFRAPTLEVHREYCVILGLDAPIHDRGERSGIPSTLHLLCHQLPNQSFRIESCAFRSPMFPETECCLEIDWEGTRRRSVVRDTASGLLLSVVVLQVTLEPLSLEEKR
jgi:citrate lyase beta subunit